MRIAGIKNSIPPRALMFALMLAACCNAAHADGGVPGWNKLVYLIYQLQVTRYCGTTTDEVAAGFRAQRDEMLTQYHFAPELVMSARAEADKLAHREWDNRGLGGFRRWCSQDAARYARNFLRANDANNSAATSADTSIVTSTADDAAATSTDDSQTGVTP